MSLEIHSPIRAAEKPNSILRYGGQAMSFLVVSLGLFLAGGLAALASGRGRNASRIGGISAIAASFAGLIPVCRLFADSLALRPAAPLALVLGNLPMGEFALRLDLLSAVFLAPVLILVAVAALSGMGNGDGCADTPEHGHGGHAGAHWFFYNLLAGGMALSLTADNAFLFLMAWELMSVAPFFLIILNDSSVRTRSAAWTYLVAAHLGALFLLAFFALLAAANNGSLSFAVFIANAGNIDPGIRGGSSLLFLLALTGFGTKAGFMPLHVWLPEAHPAAPSHVSAVMSGAMIKMGIYGLVRTFAFIGTGEAWWAYTLIAVGAFTGITGVLQAFAQSGIKRSLAFSSVENMGIVCMGVGAALLCFQNNHTGAAVLAVTGALVHMCNHAVSKGLLFLCAGCVLHGSGTVTLRLLGGLQKRMPVVGWCFVTGSAAIAALPPLNGFAGEFLIYLGMIFGGTSFMNGPYPEFSLLFWVCLFILAGIGGFTLLCFARLYGIAFLGAPRSDMAEKAHVPARNEISAIMILACLCILSAFAAPNVAKLCQMAVTPAFMPARNSAPVLTAAQDPLQRAALSPALSARDFTPPRLTAGSGGMDSAITLLREINAVFFLFILATIAAYLFRRRKLRGKTTGSSPTWDCGYLAPTAKMQYTPGSFARPAARFMRTILRQKFDRPIITEYFPIKARAALTTNDWIETGIYRPLFSRIAWLADKTKALQHGRVNGYILYILITLVALLAWKLR